MVLLGHVLGLFCLLLELLVVFLVMLSLQSDLLLLTSSVGLVDFVNVVFILLLPLSVGRVQLSNLVQVTLVGASFLLLHLLDGLFEMRDFIDELLLVGVVRLGISDDLL